MFEQVKRGLRPFPAIRFEREFGRIMLHLNGVPYEDVLPPLKRVFGLASISPVVSTELELERIQEAAASMMEALTPQPDTFKVTVRRVNKSFPHDSQAMNRLVGGAVLRALPELKVDVHRPDTELKVELREEAAWLYCRVDQARAAFRSARTDGLRSCCPAASTVR